MKSIVACNGEFNAQHFCDAYVKFMTTPGSHNDTYASTCHRQFFENYTKGVDPMKCASNDGHNTDAIDALVFPSIVALATLHKPLDEAISIAQECGEVTRRSKRVQAYVRIVVEMRRRVVLENDGLAAATKTVSDTYLRGLDLETRGMDLVTA